MKILFLDLQNGISGDMFISSLISAGVDKDFFLSNINQLKQKINFNLIFTEKKISGISAVNFKVLYEEESVYRNISIIKDIIYSVDIEKKIKEDAVNIFTILAEAESKVHNIELEKIHFHEVGAIDSIVDVIGAAICINYFKFDKIYSTPFYFGKGYINIAHGKVSVPVPAVLEITKELPVIKTDIEGELVTPTGAAIIKYYVNEYKNPPLGRLLSNGFGAGTRNYDIPNYLTGYVLKTKDNVYYNEEIYKVETNIDDISPEILSGVIDELYKMNALDVYQKSVFMKKNRMGIEVSLLVKEKNLNSIIEYLLKNTSTIGVRYNKYNRTCLNREIIEYNTSIGIIKAKKVFLPDDKYKLKFEFEDCKKIALKNNMSISEVYKILNKET